MDDGVARRETVEARRETAASARPAVVRVQGPRDAERWLVGYLDRAMTDLRSDPSRLAAPIVIVVPSQSLRQQVAARLVGPRRRSEDAPAGSASERPFPGTTEEVASADRGVTARAVGDSDRFPPGGAVAGVAVVALRTLAEEVLRRAGAPTIAGGPLFEILARRAIRAEASLAAAFGDFDDGEGLAVAALRDLLSAGLGTEARGEDVVLAATNDERGRALVRAAARVFRDLRSHGAQRPADAYPAAARALKERGASVLRAREVVIHGFADAPGLATGFLRALSTAVPTTLLLDLPRDPADSDRPDQGIGFALDFAKRLGFDPEGRDAPPTTTAQGRGADRAESAAPGLTPVSAVPPLPALPAPTLAAFTAPGVDLEAREVAARIRVLLDGGEHPEDIGIVARRLDPYLAPLRRWLTGFGIPFSGGRVPGSWAPLGRRLAGITRLVAEGAEASIETWYLALGATSFTSRDEPDTSWVSAADLKLALRVLGVTTLGSFAALPLDTLLGDATKLHLPVRRNVGGRSGGSTAGKEASTDEDEAAEGAPAPLEDDEHDAPPPAEAGHLVRRSVPRAILEKALSSAKAAVSALHAWPDKAPLSAHAAFVREIAKAHLDPATARRTAGGRDDAGAALDRFTAILGRLERTPGASLEVSREEFRLVLGPEVERDAETALGGIGGGVRVLDVARARSLTFRHLFLVGLGRDAFPRPAHDDPILGDATRRTLATVLEDLAVPSESLSEDHYLFAQLLDAAPRVTLSWPRSDDDGRELSPSVLVERLRLSERLPDVHDVPRRFLDRIQPAVGGASGPALASEFAIHAALAGERATAFALFDAALAETRRGTPVGVANGVPTERRTSSRPAAASTLAVARRRILDALEPDRRTAEGRRRRNSPSPYLGDVGRSLLDDRLPITLLERVARCPWQAFLGRHLKLQRAPDPLAGLPTIDPLLLGTAAHEALEALVAQTFTARGRAMPATFDPAKPPTPAPVPRPSDDEIARAVAAAARELCRREGLFLEGFIAVLAARIRPLVDQAIDLDWPEGRPLLVYGVELEGHFTLEAGAAATIVTCRADRVDAADGTAAAVDYKTGRPFATGRTPATRLKNLAKQVAGGAHLQGAAYTRAFGPGSRGRYVFIDASKWSSDNSADAVITLDPADPPAAKLFPTTAGALLASLRAGIAFPRLSDERGNTNSACDSCDFLAACGQQDGTTRHRFKMLALAAVDPERRPDDPPPADPAAAPQARFRATLSSILNLGRRTAEAEPEPAP